MKPVLLFVNSGHVRHPPHEGHLCTSMYVTVMLTDKPVVFHDGNNLVTIIDAMGREHLVDEWYIRHNGERL